MVDKYRWDKGRPRKCNAAGLDLMVKLLTPEPGPSGYGAMSIQTAFCEYQAELVWRREMTGKRLENGDARRWRNYLDAEGRLLPEAPLSRVAYDTFRCLVHRLPQPLLKLGRKGREAFDNTEVPYSHRDLEKLSPLDWVVMDHRQLEVFCLA